MSSALYWLIDFDETLAKSGISWALETAFPKLVKENQLSLDPVRLQQAVLAAQEKSARNEPTEVLVHELFGTMGWPAALEQPFLTDLLTNYEPVLFDDALPFMARLNEAGKCVYVLSNNPLSHGLCVKLGIEPLVQAVYSPRVFPGVKGKPDVSYWAGLQARHPELQSDNTVIVGDDPWSDAMFAQNCGLDCWIVDRRDRLSEVSEKIPFRRAQSLHEIVVTQSLPKV